MLRVRHPSPKWAPWEQTDLLPQARANIGVELAALSDNANPSVSITGTTVSPSTINDKIVLSLLIPNSNPTFTTVTYDGVAMTEIATVRQTRNNKTLCVFYMDETANRLAGRTLSVAWTNTGTQNGGGSLAHLTAITPQSQFLPGAPELVNSAQGVTQPSTGATGTPSDLTAGYVAYTALAVQNNALGAESPLNGYTAMTPQAANTTRVLILNAAVREFRQAPVATQTENWATTWNNIAWCSAILMFRETVLGSPVLVTSPVIAFPVTEVGQFPITTDGVWTNAPTSFTYDWQRDVGTNGATWVSIGPSQLVTTTNGSAIATVTSIANIHVGDLVASVNVNSLTVSAITDATHIILSGPATGSGTALTTIGWINSSGYTISASDIGSKIRCVVTATNALGSSVPAPTQAVGRVPPPATPTYRVVLNPIAQSDAKVHTPTLTLPVVAGDTLVYLGACSVANPGGDIGTITDPNGNTWRQLAEYAPTGATHAVQAFAAFSASSMAYGTVITTRVKQTTVVGVNALDSPVINVADTTGFDASSSGVFEINGVLVSYTGITATSLTGCGPHAAYTGGEFAGYHGQSPYYYIVAINPGIGNTCEFDVAAAGGSIFGATATSPAVTTKGPNSVALGFHGRNAVEQWTPTGLTTKVFDGPFANAGAPFTGESTYSISGEAQIFTAPQASLAASGNNASNDQLNSLIVVFTIGMQTVSTAEAIFPNPKMGPQGLKTLRRSHPAAVITASGIASIVPDVVNGTSAVSAAVVMNQRVITTATSSGVATVSAAVVMNQRVITTAAVAGVATVSGAVVMNKRVIITASVSGVSTVSATVSGGSGSVTTRWRSSYSPAILFLLDRKGPFA